MVRKFTNQILEMIEDGILDKDTVILAWLNFGTRCTWWRRNREEIKIKVLFPLW